jgi:hypothetical protein
MRSERPVTLTFRVSDILRGALICSYIKKRELAFSTQVPNLDKAAPPYLNHWQFVKMSGLPKLAD